MQTCQDFPRALYDDISQIIMLTLPLEGAGLPSWNAPQILIWISKLHPTTSCHICIRLLSEAGGRDPKGFLFPPSKGTIPAVGVPCLCHGVPNSQLARAPRGSSAQFPAAGKPWAGILAQLSSPALSPLPDLLFLTGLASSVFIVSELVKLCEKRCCHPKHTKGCHNWLRVSKIHLEQSCDAG